MLRVGQPVELTIEKPAAGGRMLARYDGQVVLVAGGIPGERLIARIERVQHRLAFATTTQVVEASPDRREAFADPLCGGCIYSHIAYSRQTTLKAEIVHDAFLRLGRIPLDAPIDVAVSPERGYRMRARLHVDLGRAGFYREGTHTLCDAAKTGQLSDASLAAISEALVALEREDLHPTSIELTENIAGDQRALAIARAGNWNGNIGLESVADPLAVLTCGRAREGELHRRPQAFFQANRYLLPELVTAVLDAVVSDGPVIDLYAGVGLFSVALAATGRDAVTAVEGDRASGADLQRNASPFGERMTLALESVEDYLADGPRTVATVVLDPPRTGVSSDAMAGLLKLNAARLVYVSCDAPTLARDARRLLDAGYALESLRGFDLFPNTSHVEVLGVFGR